MLKYVFILYSIILTSSDAIGQLVGTYEHAVGGIGTTKIRFKEGNQFEYEIVDCTGFRCSKGSYKSKGSKLILTVEKPQTLMPTVIIKKTALERADSVNFKFFVSEISANDSVVSEGTSVKFTDPATNNVIHIAVIDEVGQLRQTLYSKDIDSLRLDISSDYCMTYTNTIAVDSDYSFNIFLKCQSFKAFDPNSAFIFKMRKRQKGLLLKSSYPQSKFRMFLKK